MQKTSWGKSSNWYSKIVGESGHYYHQHVVLPKVVELLALKKEESLLDLGCGQGVLARSLPPNTEYVGIDISGALINEAKRLDHNPRHIFMMADVSKRLSLTKQFDHVAVVLALQNIKDINGVFANMGHHLKPGGNAVIALNHPCFRIPRQSGWSVDSTDKLQKRWINRYMSPLDIPIAMHPSQRSSNITWSFHYPLATYVKSITSVGLLISDIEELVSDRESSGKMKKMENRGRAEIPLFMVIKAVKL